MYENVQKCYYNQCENRSQTNECPNVVSGFDDKQWNYWQNINTPNVYNRLNEIIMYFIDNCE